MEKREESMKNIIKVESILIVVVLLSLFPILPVRASSSNQNADIKITKIKLNKKKLIAGDKLSVKINIRTNKKIKSLKVYFVGPFYNDYGVAHRPELLATIKMKSTNKSNTKWEGTVNTKKTMVRGNWGIAEVNAKLKAGGDYTISNNRWRLDNGWKYKRENLSAGNFKVKGK